MQSCMRRSSAWLEWFPVLMRYGGFGGVVFMVGVWLLTGRTEPGFVALFGGMMGIGEGMAAIKDLIEKRPPPPGTGP